MVGTAEIRAQLTGPGGMFEVVTEDVLGRPLAVYKERMRSLREIPQAAIARGDEQTFLAYGDQTWGFRRFVETANGVAHALTERCRVGPGDRVAVLAQNNPEWCLAFWATVSLDAILVGLNGWWKADEILYGLADSGAKVLVADRKRFERIADHLGEAPELTHVFLIDAGPEDFPDAASSTTVTRCRSMSSSAWSGSKRPGGMTIVIPASIPTTSPEWHPETWNSGEVSRPTERSVV